MLDFEMLRQRLHQFYGQGHFLPRVEFRPRVQTVVASAAIVFRVIFTEVAEQQLPAAFSGLGVRQCLHQQLTPDFLFGDRFALQELVQFADILITIVCDADAFLAVTARPSGFLIIAFQTSRDVVVDDKTHIRLVDSHSECNGRHDHVHILHQKTVLVLGPDLGVQACVIRHGTYSVDYQHLSKLFDFLAAEAIYDSSLARILFYIADDVLVRLHLVTYLVIKVRPVERRFEHLRL